MELQNTRLFFLVTPMWRSEDNSFELFLSLLHVGSGNGTQVIRLGRKSLTPSSPTTLFFFLKVKSVTAGGAWAPISAPSDQGSLTEQRFSMVSSSSWY